MAWSLWLNGTVNFVNKRWLEYTGIPFEEELKDPTCPVHHAKIMLKLDLHSLADLIHYAIRQGLHKELSLLHPPSPHEDHFS
jgi:hypothetical protein